MNLFIHKNRYLLYFLSGLLIIFSVFISSPNVASAAPGLPAGYSGTVTIGGSTAGSGKTVSAQINGETVATTTTDSSGQYALAVPGNAGDTIYFYVGTTKTSQSATFVSGEIKTINLSVTSYSATSATALSISTSTLSAGVVGTSLSRTVSATGGAGSYTFTLASGNLPDGLSLSSAGAISGTPTTAATSTFTVQVTDDNSATASKTFSLTINSTATTTTTTTTTTSQTSTVSANVMGTTSSFSISSGAVPSAVSLASSDGAVSFSLSANTAVNLQGATQLSIVQLASTPTAPSNARVIEAYSCGPDDATFNPSASITIKYDPASIPSDVDEQNLYIALLQGTSWSPLSSSVNTSAHTVTAQISHFSTYGLMGAISNQSTPSTPTQTQTAQGIAYSDISVDPLAVNAGSPVVIALRVVNNNSSSNSPVVNLIINGKSEAQKTVQLAAGKSQIVTFNVTKNEAGTYNVEVGDLSTSFVVTGSSTSSSSSGPAWPVIIFALLGIAIIAVLARILIMRSKGDF